MMYILENPVSCYRYSRNLRARAQFIDDLRFKWHKWTEEDEARFEAEEDAFLEHEYERFRDDHPECRPVYPRWYDAIFMRYREEAPDKTLVVMDYATIVGEVIRNHIDWTAKTERSLVVSFFHNDEEMQDLLWMNTSTETLIEEKVDWIQAMLFYPFIKTVEIGYNFTLTEAYLKDLFNTYVIAPGQ